MLNFGTTHRHILVLTQVKLGIDSSVGKFWKAAEKLWDELCGQTLLLGTTLDAIQNHLVGIFMLQTEQPYIIQKLVMRMF